MEKNSLLYFLDKKRSYQFNICVSSLVFQEAIRVDPKQAKMRLAVSAHFPMLDMDILREILETVNYD
jgi:hypothetical protein